MENYSSVTKVGIPPNYNCRNEERNRLYALIREFSSILYSGDKIIINGRDGEINRDNRNIQISENYYPDQQRGGRGFYRERGLPPKFRCPGFGATKIIRSKKTPKGVTSPG